jgi:hypothetical protein
MRVFVDVVERIPQFIEMVYNKKASPFRDSVLAPGRV